MLSVGYVVVHTCTNYIMVCNGMSYFQYGHSTVALWLLYNIHFSGNSLCRISALGADGGV